MAVRTVTWVSSRQFQEVSTRITWALAWGWVAVIIGQQAIGSRSFARRAKSVLCSMIDATSSLWFLRWLQMRNVALVLRKQAALSNGVCDKCKTTAVRGRVRTCLKSGYRCTPKISSSPDAGSTNHSLLIIAATTDQIRPILLMPIPESPTSSPLEHIRMLASTRCTCS